MARAVTRAKEEQERLDAIEQDRRKVKGVLDQLTKSLEAYEDDDDLLRKITELYDALDEDGSGRDCPPCPCLCICMDCSGARTRERARERGWAECAGRRQTGSSGTRAEKAMEVGWRV